MRAAAKHRRRRQDAPVTKGPARAVIPGLGVVSPIGIGVDAFWKNAVAGRSGVSAVSGFDGLPLEGYRCQVAGQVLDFDPAQLPEDVHPERLDRYAQLALLATKDALEDAGLRMQTENPRRVGVILGAGMGGMLIGE